LGKTFAITNQKGGVAKTTTVINLGAALGQRGQKVLLLDADPQGNVTSGLGLDRHDVENSIYDVLINNIPLESIIINTAFEGVDLAPATISLAGAEIELVSAIARESKLKKALRHVRQRYDYILIDCPPSLGLLTLNALTAADGIIIPVQCEYYALEGLGQLMNTFELVRKHLNPELAIAGVLLTMYDNRVNLAADVVKEVKEYFGNLVFESIIPRNVRLSEAPSHGKPIIYYDPRSKGAQMYQSLAIEVIKRG